MQGIDVSRWQGVIAWDAVKSAKQFAIIKLGGSDDGLYPDGQGVRNAKEARRVGIQRGFYFYLGGVFDVAAEVQHIKNCIANIGGLQAGECIALDWEEHRAGEVQYVTDIAKGLIDAGFPKPLIYMSLSRVKGADWSPLVALDCGLWVASWGDNDAVLEPNEIATSEEWPFVAMQQYSSTGSVPGISGRVDLDVFNGTPEAFTKYGAAGQVTPTPEQPTPTPPAPPSDEYIVAPGDNLSNIAARLGVSWQTLWSWNRDRVSNPDRIFPGQVLRVKGSVPQPPAPVNKTYTVHAGDNLSSIAARFNTSWQRLYEINKGVIGPNPNFIKPGQVLQLP